MASYKEGLNNILQAINNMISPQLVSLKYDKTFRGKITKIIDAGVYEVQVNGNVYRLPYNGSLNVGDIVKVKSPLNNFSDIYIEAIGGSGGSGTSTDYNDLTNKPNLNTTASSSLPISSSEIIKDTINLHKISKTGKYDDLVGKPTLDFIPNSEKGAAGGVATLDNDSKLPTSQLPDGIITDPDYTHTDNNFTDALLAKLNGIETGAQVNKIETISRNGTALPITNKNVNIEVPTKLSELENDNNTVTDKDYVHTDNNFTNALLTKLNGIEAGAEVNAIAGIKVNDILQPITNKIVNISVPTKVSQLENDEGYLKDIPIATTTTLGTIKVGENLSITEDGTLNAEAGGVTSYNNLTDRPILNTNVSATQALRDDEVITGTILLHRISKSGNYEDLNNKPTIPTKTSDLTNDSGFIDKDVNNLTNYYTETEVDNLLNEKANKTDIPTKVSQLENDTGFITNTVNNLTNYYLKSETYTQTEVNNLIGQIKTISIEVVDKLPETGEDNKIYLVPKEGSTGDVYNEYIWVNNAWELIGSTQIDLTGYATEDWVNAQIKDFVNEAQVTQLINNSLTNYYTQTQVDTLLENKADKSSIPTKTSDLTNDSGYIDNTVNNLINYYNKTETYNQTQVNDLLGSKANTTDIPTKVSELENDEGYLTEIPIASTTTLGGIKVGNNLDITEDGILSAKGGTTNYEDLTNKPTLNTNVSASQAVRNDEVITGQILLHKVSKSGSYGDLNNKPEIPANTSDLNNDSGFITNTVNDLTNYYKKTETYTQTEVDNLLSGKASTSDIPTKTSQLTNDSGYIDNTVDNLENYYKKTETYNQTEVNNLLGDKADKTEIPTKVSQLENDKDYLTEIPVASKTQLGGVKVGNNLEVSTDGTLSANVPTKTSELTNDGEDGITPFISEIPVASSTQLGGVKVGDNLSITADGTLSATGGTKDYNDLTNKPTLNTNISTSLPVSEGETITGEMSLHRISKTGNYSDLLDKPNIPANTSDLNNDSGFITKDVNNLTNYYNKTETYTQTQVNNLLADKADVEDIPITTSQLANDSGFITNSVDDLTNYYKKSETYNQTQVNNLLNDKANKTDIPTKVSELENDKGYISEIPIASASQLGGIKVGDNLNITEDGVLSAVGGGTGTTDYTALSNKPILNTNNSTALTVNAQEEINGTISLHKVSKTGNYNDLSNKPTIPTKTSDLTNNSGFITNSVNNLTNYYKKTETYTQTQVNNLLADKADVEDIPTATSQLTNDSGYIDNNVDSLTNYYTKAEINNTLDGKTVPAGGTAGQVLTKNSSTAGDTSWKTIAPKIIKNETFSSDVSSFVFLSSFEEGIYKFVMEGYFPGNTQMSFDGLTNTSKFSFSCSNTYTSGSSATLFRQWFDSGVSTIIPIVGYNNINQYQNAIGTIEIRGNTLSYKASSLAKGRKYMEPK